MKYRLLKRASKIHSVKCNKSSDFNEILISNDKLKELMNKIDNMDSSENLSIEADIEAWRNTKPIAHENEIILIIKKKN